MLRVPCLARLGPPHRPRVSLALLVLAAVAWAGPANAQITAVSNIGNSDNGGVFPASGGIASSFFTGTTTADLVSISVLLNSYDNFSSGGSVSYIARILSDAGGTPGATVVATSLTPFVDNVPPSGATNSTGVFSFANIPLAAGTTYWVELTGSATGTAGQGYRLTNQLSSSGALDWDIGNDLAIVPGPGSFSSTAMLFEVNVAAVPEPSTYALLCLAGLAGGVWRWRRSRRPIA